MNQYVKDLVIKLHTEFDKTQLSDTEKEFAKLSSIKFLDEKQLAKFKESFTEIKKQLYSIDELKKVIKEQEMFGNDIETLKELKKELNTLENNVKDKQSKLTESYSSEDKKLPKFQSDFKKELSNSGDRLMQKYLGGTNMAGILANKLEEVATKIIEGIKQAITNAMNELNSMAGYNLAGSYTYNSEAWATTMTYGTSPAQSYALNKAMARLNISSDEELFQAMMSPNFRQQWAEDIGYYTDKYNTLAQSDLLESFQEFQLEFSRLKEDFTYKIMDWIVANKDTIIKVLNFSMQFMEVVMNLLAGIADILLPDSERSEADKRKATLEILSQGGVNKQTNLDALANSSYNSSSTTYNTNINSNINYPKADTKTLLDLPSMMYKEVIDAISK